MYWYDASQRVDLWWFGAKWRKPTALRLHNLPLLAPTAHVDEPERLPSLPQSVIRKNDADARDRERSRFVPELGEAMAHIKKNGYPIRGTLA